MEVIVDPKSGFCFGVKRAIDLAEEYAGSRDELYCLGEIVHNAVEVGRLENFGVRFIDRDTFFSLSNCTVLFRAHGEPPETYEYASSNNIEIIDATCTVVLKLQERIRTAQKQDPLAQIVIYGKPNHPEVIGLKGQVNEPLILETVDEHAKIDFNRPVSLFAQTTKDKKGFAELERIILMKLAEAGKPATNLRSFNSICGQVANRGPWLADFSATVDTLVFVGGRNSSNSKVLFEVCKKHNPNSYFIADLTDVGNLPVQKKGRIGITGATSTPLWLIEKIAERIRELAY